MRQVTLTITFPADYLGPLPQPNELLLATNDRFPFGLTARVVTDEQEIAHERAETVA